MYIFYKESLRRVLSFVVQVNRLKVAPLTYRFSIASVRQFLAGGFHLFLAASCVTLLQGSTVAHGSGI